MKPYTNQDSTWRYVVKFLLPIFLGAFCLIYGFFFALTAPYLLLPFSAPIVVMVLLSIWALPDRPHAPTKATEFLFAALIICLILWPNYLALALPGLPWITAIRLTGFPMAFMLLICLSTSKAFRAELRETLTSVPRLTTWFAVFIAIQFITLLLAKSPSFSLQKAIIQQINWTCVFVIAAWACRKSGRAEKYIGLIFLLSIPIIIVTVFESIEKHVLWSGDVPSFLKIDDPTAALILSSTIRTASGLYRAKATFSTPLGLAEYLSLLTPFAIHFAVGRYSPIVKMSGVLFLPVVFYCVRLTDARLGVVGFLVSIMLYFLFWGLLRLRRNGRDLLAATIVYAYPALFAAAAAAVTFIRPVHTVVFGGGAQAASDQARRTQLFMGMPKVVENPIGFGAGGSGGAMGYAPGDFITIDNYYLSVALDYGVIGLVVFPGIFLIVIAWAVRMMLHTADSKDRELGLLTPLAVALSAFLVIKIVFSQQDNHPLIFMMLGILVALSYRASVYLRPSDDVSRPDVESHRFRAVR